ncbi:MAG: flagellar basal-body rod protein FlgF [Bdellovibrionaceae bacterium]|nr:flagellar basal-body rod protein FlgF [Pseudobdellovibrionaceae bacterium]MDW8190648.1 flagellar basal-body rod protein FlgF [Pseudobdellovibrionaceae bacterium]
MAAKGIYMAVSGALAQSQRLDTIANNIANANTVGFKRDQQTFREYLTQLEKSEDMIRVPRIPASVESFYHLHGEDQSYVDTAGTYTDFSQGVLLPTGNKLDLAIDGDGFFEIATPNGIRLTRKGNFKIDGNGMLVTSEGYPVLSADEGAVEDRVIRLDPSRGDVVDIHEDGGVYQGGSFVAQIAVVKVNDQRNLRKMGNSYFDFINDEQNSLALVEQPTLRSGFLEGSNVNVVKEMTDMIQASRAFETNQKAIQAYDMIADKLVNQVGKVSA